MPPKEYPTEATAHLAQARHNYALYGTLREAGSHPDWALTVLFYTVLHLIEAHAALNEERRMHSHFARREYVGARVPNLRRHFRPLEDACRSARYELWQPSLAQVAWFHAEHFAPIQAELRRHRIAL